MLSGLLVEKFTLKEWWSLSFLNHGPFSSLSCTSLTWINNFRINIVQYHGQFFNQLVCIIYWLSNTHSWNELFQYLFETINCVLKNLHCCLLRLSIFIKINLLLQHYYNTTLQLCTRFSFSSVDVQITKQRFLVKFDIPSRLEYATGILVLFSLEQSIRFRKIDIWKSWHISSRRIATCTRSPNSH